MRTTSSRRVQQVAELGDGSTGTKFENWSGSYLLDKNVARRIIEVIEGDSR